MELTPSSIRVVLRVCSGGVCSDSQFRTNPRSRSDSHTSWSRQPSCQSHRQKGLLSIPTSHVPQTHTCVVSSPSSSTCKQALAGPSGLGDWADFGPQCHGGKKHSILTGPVQGSPGLSPAPWEGKLRNAKSKLKQEEAQKMRTGLLSGLDCVGAVPCSQ